MHKLLEMSRNLELIENEGNGGLNADFDVINLSHNANNTVIN